MSGDHDKPDSVEELESRIEQTREQLAETVDALSAKADVRARAGARVERTRAQVRDAVTDHGGSLRPEVGIAAGAVLLGILVLVVWRRRRR